MSFSVLMSIYSKENARYFDRAMTSIWDEQTVKPSEIILVEDGKLTDELYSSISQWKEKIGSTFRIVPLEKNVGLGDALNIGLQKCSYELVARMDTDDICVNNRFEKQLKIFKNSDIDICSSWVSEFDKNENEIISYRKLPEQHLDIIKYAKHRCPINHPAVMYKKQAVKDAGGYVEMILLEDYYLWGRMILNDAKFYNIEEPLVNMRAGYGQLERRRGMKYFLSEYSLHKTFLSIGLINYLEFTQNIIIRLFTRMLPKSILKYIYNIIRR
jgi:glycosyltransferase involved in cell wall biosynthesis